MCFVCLACYPQEIGVRALKASRQLLVFVSRLLTSFCLRCFCFRPWLFRAHDSRSPVLCFLSICSSFDFPVGFFSRSCFCLLDCSRPSASSFFASHTSCFPLFLLFHLLFVSAPLFLQERSRSESEKRTTSSRATAGRLRHRRTESKAATAHAQKSRKPSPREIGENNHAVELHASCSLLSACS